MAGKDSGSLLLLLHLFAVTVAARQLALSASRVGSREWSAASLACCRLSGSRSAPLAGRAGEYDLSGAQTVRAVHHHLLARLQAAVQDGHLSLGQSHLH